jgi:hypothetical protein
MPTRFHVRAHCDVPRAVAVRGARCRVRAFLGDTSEAPSGPFEGDQCPGEDGNSPLATEDKTLPVGSTGDLTVILPLNPLVIQVLRTPCLMVTLVVCTTVDADGVPPVSEQRVLTLARKQGHAGCPF